MAKKFDLAKYKESVKASDTPLKKDKYVVVDEALQEVVGLPGLPMGHITQIFGPSDSGKSTLGFHAAVQAQKDGILPIFIITESKVSWDRAEAMGLNVGDCLVFYAEYLEDIFGSIDRVLADMQTGKLPLDCLLIVDSIGNSISSESVTVNKDGTTSTGKAMMKAARVIRENMRVLSHKVNNTRKITSPNTAGLVFVNHSYKKPPDFPGGPTTDIPYGGDGIYYVSSLVLKTRKGRKLEATKNKKKVKFGMVSKISVEKNHLVDVTNSGEFVITADAIIPNESGAITDYKDAHKERWGEAVIMEAQDE